MSDGDRCEWCSQPAQPPAVVPYLFYSRAGEVRIRWLHPSPCSREAQAAYVERRRQWAAEAGMFDGA